LTTSDLPGVDCTAHCTSTWDSNASVTLSAMPHPGYSHIVWGGACAGPHAGTDCTLVMTANQPVSVSFLKTLAVASFTAPRQVGKRLQVQLRLSRAPATREANIACRATTGLKLVAHAIARNIATCAWSVPSRLHGRRVTGHITVSTDSGGTLGRAWALKLRR
jgi:hypothetical protein